MSIVGHGIDIVKVSRIARMLAEHGERFLERCFTPDERAYALRGPRAAEHLAARFAAKEAVLKALGTGWRNGIGWTDVEVVLEPSGRPTVRLWNVALETAQRLGIVRWSLSLSHTDELAAASAVGSS